MSKDKQLFKQVKSFSASAVRSENMGIETEEKSEVAKTSSVSHPHHQHIKGLEITIVSLKKLGYKDDSPEVKAILKKIAELKI